MAPAGSVGGKLGYTHKLSRHGSELQMPEDGHASVRSDTLLNLFSKHLTVLTYLNCASLVPEAKDLIRLLLFSALETFVSVIMNGKAWRGFFPVLLS